MGNHGSKRKHRKHMYENADEHNEGDSEDFEGITPDSYDKLLAWMIEMAQNDDVNMQSPTFVEHLTTVCADKRSRFSRANTYSRQHSLDVPNRLDVPIRQHSLDVPNRLDAPIRQHSLDVPNRLDAPIRQHSYDSSCSSRNSRASRSREDLLDARTRFRRTMLSRQATVDYSDEGDGAEAPMDISSGSSFDNDSDLDAAGPRSLLIRDIGETSFTKSVDIPEKSPNQYYGNGYQNFSNSVGDLLHGKCNINAGARKKSKSLMTMRRMMSENRNDDEITPITEETVVKVLDDNLLDRNMADILYSVEALWPKIPSTK